MSTLRSIEHFLKQTGMAPTAFGREAVRDHQTRLSPVQKAKATNWTRLTN